MIELYKGSEHFFKQLPKGVFMTVKGEQGVNTMTIAWGHLGIIWNKPVFIAYVRYSRYTYSLLKTAKCFTINVPKIGDLNEALKIAGTQSGRDGDKFHVAQLTVMPSQTVETPVIKECPLNYECKLLYRQTQEPSLIPQSIQTKHYPNDDTHIMFFGEITHISENDNA